MWLLLNILGFSVWLSKGEKEKNEMVRGDVCPLNPLESLQPEGERLVSIMGSSIMATASLHPSDQKQELAIRAQIPCIWRVVFVCFCFFSPPGLCSFCAGCSRNTSPTSCYREEDGSWIAATVLRAKIAWINHSLPSSTSPGSCRPSTDYYGIQYNSKFVTSHRFCLPVQLLSVWQICGTSYCAIFPESILFIFTYTLSYIDSLSDSIYLLMQYVSN